MLGGCNLITPAPGGSCTGMSMPNLAASSWKAYAYVFNLTDFSQSNYIDGSQINKSSIPNASYGNVSGINIGIYSPTCVDASHGLFDEVRVYNRALSASEIQAIYEATK